MPAATKKMKELVFAKFGERCFYCGTTDPDPFWTMDHVVPLCIGGLNCHTNMVVACNYCNNIKKKDGVPTMTQLHSLEFYWGTNHIPKNKWESLCNGTWKPVEEIIRGKKRPIIRKHKMWLRNSCCVKCGVKTRLMNGYCEVPPDDMACLTNDERGKNKVIHCWSCVKKRDKNPGFQLTRLKELV